MDASAEDVEDEYAEDDYEADMYEADDYEADDFEGDDEDEATVPDLSPCLTPHSPWPAPYVGGPTQHLSSVPGAIYGPSSAGPHEGPMP